MSKTRLFDAISDWLLERALVQMPITDTIKELGNKIVDGGIPLARINIGALIMHPVLGAMDITWDAESDTCTSKVHARKELLNIPDFTNAPFYHMCANDIPFMRFKLSNTKEREEFPLLKTLHKNGMNDYVALSANFGKPIAFDFDTPEGLSQNASMSFATSRMTGFSDQDIENIRSLRRPLGLAIKSTLAESFAKALVETYLGRLSGGNVLSGTIQKGDAKLINCVLWYSDMRGSTALASSLDIDAYFQTLNDYFDCTAGSVLDHGGEVLKFTGDGIMSIFPIDDVMRPVGDMCNAAMMTAQEALSRMDALNEKLGTQGQDPIGLGIGLHVGKVMYGNVGIDRRMDMTVTGPAVNEAARMESLCKPLKTPIIASQEFQRVFDGDLTSLGLHKLNGITPEMEAFTPSNLTT